MHTKFLRWYSGASLKAMKEEALPLLEAASKQGWITKKDLRRVNTILSKANVLQRLATKIQGGRGNWQGSMYLVMTPDDWYELHPKKSFSQFEASIEGQTNKVLNRCHHFMQFPSAKRFLEMSEIITNHDWPKLSGRALDAYEAAKEVALDFMEVATLIEELGEGISESDVEKYKAPRSAWDTRAKIHKLVSAQMDEVYEETVKWHVFEITGGLEACRKMKSAGGDSLRAKIWKESAYSPAAVAHQLAFDHDDNERPDAAARIDAHVRNYIVKPMRERFCGKTADKLGAIIEKRKDLKEISSLGVEVSAGAFTGSILVTFESGDEFKAVTNVKWNTSSRGKPFIQLPTTFHDVKIGGNSFVFMSERAMNDGF